MGRPLQLVMQDGQCQGAKAVSAFKKLTEADELTYILGGFCGPESSAIAPLAEKTGAVILAAMSSSPNLSGINPNFFRISVPSTVAGEMIASYAYQHAGRREMVIFQEETDYVLVPAQRIQKVFKQQGGRISAVFSFPSGETDFRPMLSRIRAALGIDSLYIGTQSIDTARIIVRQFSELGYKLPLYGNEAAAHAASGQGSVGSFENMVFAEPEFDPLGPATARFIQDYCSEYKVSELPSGF